jgi:ABC-2 type transport system ATP-binding protein
VALVAALASDVELLLLDEPTSGLDPLTEEVFRQVIREDLRRGDRTVLLSSHSLAEVEALCDRVRSSATAGPWRPARWRSGTS